MNALPDNYLFCFIFKGNCILPIKHAKLQEKKQVINFHKIIQFISIIN